MSTTTLVAQLGLDEGLTLPAQIRQATGLAAGDTLVFEVIDAGDTGLQVRPRKIDPD